MGAHPDAHHGNLDDVGIAPYILGAEFPGHALENTLGLGEIIALHREGEVGFTRLRNILEDYVHIDIGRGNRAQNGIGDARMIGHTDDGDFRLIAGEGDTGDTGSFHRIFLIGNQGAGTILKRRQDPHGNMVFHGEFDGTGL